MFSDGAESGSCRLDRSTASRRRRIGSPPATTHYYIAGYRTYVSYDQYLKTGPYYFGYPTRSRTGSTTTRTSTGLLISYWDTSQPDNNVNVHPGEGRNLYIDAHPTTALPARRRAVAGARSRSTTPRSASARPTRSRCTSNSQASYIRGPAAQPLFDDTKDYFDEALPNHGVKLPAVGVKIRVLEENGTSAKIRVS